MEIDLSPGPHGGRESRKSGAADKADRLEEGARVPGWEWPCRVDHSLVRISHGGFSSGIYVGIVQAAIKSWVAT